MAQIVVINSVNSLSGKTLLASHLGVVLAKDYKTAVMDSEGENSPLAMFIARRHALNLSKEYNLPVPAYHSLEKNIFEQKSAEYDVIILDSPDEKYLKEADILITPVKNQEGFSAVCDPRSLYAALVWNIKKKRAMEGKSAFRWVLVPNGVCSDQNRDALIKVGKMLGYTTAPLLNRRSEYDEGLKTGITAVDKDLPDLKTLFELPDLYARRELKKIAEFIWRNK